MIKKFDKTYLYTMCDILPAPKIRDTIILLYRSCYITHDKNIKLYYYLIFIISLLSPKSSVEVTVVVCVGVQR